MAVVRSTYDKMKYNNFHGILLAFLLYQSANDNLSYLTWCSLHFLVNLQGGQDWGGHAMEAETKPKIIHPYWYQIREKYTNKFSKLHCLNLIAFYSKSC